MPQTEWPYSSQEVPDRNTEQYVEEFDVCI